VAVAADGKSAFVGTRQAGRPPGEAARARRRRPSSSAAWPAPARHQLGAAGARGLALDGKGHVLISDFANNRVIGRREGRQAGRLPRGQGPESLGADPASGAVYVLADAGRSLAKFSGWKDAKELARLPIDPGGNGTAVMTRRRRRQAAGRLGGHRRVES